MSFVSVLMVFALAQFSLCRPHSGEDHSSGEEDDISYERDGWRYAPRVGNRILPPSLASPALMNMLAMIANGFGRQPTTPSALLSGRPTPRPRPQQTLSTSLLQQLFKPAQGPSGPYSIEGPTTQRPNQPYRPQGGWGVQLIDPMLNLTQLLG